MTLMTNRLFFFFYSFPYYVWKEFKCEIKICIYSRIFCNNLYIPRNELLCYIQVVVTAPVTPMAAARNDQPYINLWCLRCVGAASCLAKSEKIFPPAGKLPTIKDGEELPFENAEKRSGRFLSSITKISHPSMADAAGILAYWKLMCSQATILDFLCVVLVHRALVKAHICVCRITFTWW